MDNGFIHAILGGQVGADMMVAAFDFVADGFADVVEQGGGFGDADIGADFFGDHSGQMRHFN